MPKKMFVFGDNENPDFDHWIVSSQSDPDKIYSINIEQQTCTCPSFKYRLKACKHILLSEEYNKTYSRVGGIRALKTKKAPVNGA